MNKLTQNIIWNNVNATTEQIKEYVKNYARDNNVSYANLVISNGNVSFTTYSKIGYENLVNAMVRERYSDSEELAILRKAINGITDEYRIYNLYVEECKTKAKQFIQERNSVLGE